MQTQARGHVMSSYIRHEILVNLLTNIVHPQKFSNCYMRKDMQTKRCVCFDVRACPCIASISLKYNQQDATFSRSIYFYKLLYMFQVVNPLIIRNTKLYIQPQVLSKQYCCLLLSWIRWKQFHLIHDSSRQQYWFDNTWRCMYSFVFLMMGGETA
jgi:hypothetical protein